MGIKKEVSQDLKFENLKVKQVYRSKNPKIVGLFYKWVDDREVLYISPNKCVVGHIDHGYTPEFEEWCKKKAWPSRSLLSEIDQHEFEKESDYKLSAKNIETVFDYMVQYNSPSVKIGSKYPSIPASKFLKWAAKDVTDIMPPDGDWANSL